MPSMTITTTAGQGTRLAEAVGKRVNADGSPASAAQIKDFVIDQLRILVTQYEDKRDKAAVAAPASFDPT